MITLLGPDGTGGITLGVPIVGPFTTLEGLRQVDNRFQGTVDMTDNTLENVADPVDGKDATNKDYVDSIGSAWMKDEFTPTNNQVTFVLSSSPTDLDTVNFEVNGVTYDDIDDFTILGNTITWLDTEFQMQTTDHVVVRYR